MGGGHYDRKLYSASSTYRATKGIKDFAYSADTLSEARETWAAHEDLDPRTIKDSVTGMRESRDSEDHPESRPVGVIFDVTGSMRDVPRIFQKNLNNLMSLLVLKDKIEHPQVLIGAIGDATCDQVPLQLSQFESNNLVDEHLRKLVLEGGGGGHITESYELALYAMARFTALDCLEKRGQKGYLFLSGDETPYPAVKKEEIERVFGITEQAHVPLADIFAEVQEKFEVFFIIPTTTSHGKDQRIYDTWAEYLGQRVLRLEDPAAICELVASTIAAEEGLDIADIMDSLKEAGTDDTVIETVTKTLVSATA